LARYRYLRGIGKRVHSDANGFLAKDALMQQGRRLGLVDGRTFILDSMDELTLIMDLALHTAPPGRSRAIERYARSAQFASGSDEARVLEAMCNARFAIMSVVGRHPIAGLIVRDLAREDERWLGRRGTGETLPDGMSFATRFYTPDRFSVTAGGRHTGHPRVARRGGRCSALSAPQVSGRVDRRPPLCRGGLYRRPCGGVMERVRFEDPPGLGEPA